MSKSAGKTGTRKRPRGARGTGGGRILAHVFSFIAGALTAQGAGATINGAVESTKKEDGTARELHPAVDGVLAAGGGMVVSGVSAAAKPLRPFVLSEIAGNATGGVIRGMTRWWMNRTKAAGRNTRDQMRQRRLANGAGQSTGEQMREARMSALQRRFAATAN